jgi:hypothetical protein
MCLNLLYSVTSRRIINKPLFMLRIIYDMINLARMKTQKEVQAPNNINFWLPFLAFLRVSDIFLN